MSPQKFVYFEVLYIWSKILPWTRIIVFKIWLYIHGDLCPMPNYQRIKVIKRLQTWIPHRIRLSLSLSGYLYAWFCPLLYHWATRLGWYNLTVLFLVLDHWWWFGYWVEYMQYTSTELGTCSTIALLSPIKIKAVLL